MSRRCITGWVASFLVLAGVVTPGVGVGAAPTFERIVVDETFAPDEFLTEACGVVVTSHLEGHITLRTFSGEGTGVAEVRSINIGITATADDRIFRFRDVGADVTRIEPDGTAVVSVAGQVPFFFAGVLKIDLETGEAIFEPRDRSAEQLAQACAALTGG
jgi:hypothetical protein